jgi:hypothetical protein
MTFTHPAGFRNPGTADELHARKLICPVYSDVAPSPRPSDPPEWCHPDIAAQVRATNGAASRHRSWQPGGVSPLATPTGRV